MEPARSTTVRITRRTDVDRTKRDLQGLAIGLCLTIAVLLLMFLVEGYQAFELRFLDLRFTWREKLAPIAHTDRIVHVDIDDQSIAALGRWPWDRKVHATFVSTLAALGPKAIVFDVEFPDPVSPVYDPEMVRANLAEGIDALKKGVLPPDPDHPDETPTDISQLTLADVQKAFELSHTLFDRGFRSSLTDDDGVFAAAVARAACVYLPCSLEEEKAVERRSVERAVTKLLERDIRMDAPALAKALGIEMGDLPPSLRELKERVAYERALALVRSHAQVTDQAVWEALAPGSDAPVDSRMVPETEITREACRMARAALVFEERDVLPLGEGRVQESSPVRRVFAPVPYLAKASRGGGFVSVQADPLDGKLRRLKLLWQAGGKWYPQHILREMLDLYDIPRDGVTIEEGPTLVLKPKADRPIQIPLDERGRVIVNWVAGDWNDYLGRHVSYANVIMLERRLAEAGRIFEDAVATRHLTVDLKGWSDALASIAPEVTRRPSPTTLAPAKGLARVKGILAAMKEAIAKELADAQDKLAHYDRAKYGPKGFLQVLERDLKAALDQGGRVMGEAEEIETELRRRVSGKVCLVGDTHFSSTDIKATPLHSMFPGVALHSNLFNMIEERAFLTRAKPLTNAGIILFIGLFVTLVSIRSGPVRALLLTAGIVLLFALTGFWAFMAKGFWIDFLGPFMAATLCYAFIATFNVAMEMVDRDRVETLWGQYVSPAVVELLLKNPELQKIFAERRVVTMLFSDVAGFTKESERLDAETVSHLINDYLEDMSAPIVTYDGYLNKYEGDAIMAFWGAPIAQPDQAVRACFAALDMTERLRKLQLTFKEKGLPAMNTRIGINTGLVFVGNFGSKKKFDYTAIGDHVNLASRLEGANKAMKTSLLIAEATFNGAKEFVEARRLGRIRVVGRDTPVGIYELLCRVGEVPQVMKDVRPVFEAGLVAYEKGDWAECEARMRQVLVIRPEDGPSQVYLEQLEELKGKPAPDGWDGVIKLESK